MNIHIYNAIAIAQTGTPQEKDAVYSALSYAAQGARFAPSYQSGQWDGRIRLYTEPDNTIRFPAGLVPQAMQAIENTGGICNLYDHRVAPTAAFAPIALDGVTLRPYQERLIAAICDTASGILRYTPEATDACYNNVGLKTPYRIAGTGLWWSATGSGKTEAAAGLIAQLCVKTLFVVYSNDLVLQTYERFNRRIGAAVRQEGKSLGIALTGREEIGFVTVASAHWMSAVLHRPAEMIKKVRKILQTAITETRTETHGNTVRNLCTRLNRCIAIDEQASESLLTELDGYTTVRGSKSLHGFATRYAEASGARDALLRWLETIDLLICDEAHQAGSDTMYDILTACPAYYRVGMSGTPLDRSGKDNLRVIAALGECVARITNAEMVAANVIPAATIHLVPIHPQSADEMDTHWPQCYEQSIVSHAPRNACIQRIALRAYAAQQKVLILFRYTEHGRILSDLLRTVPHAVLDGANDTFTRMQAVKDLKEGRIAILIASDIFQQGIDIPCIDVLINAAAGKAPIPVLQRLGRGLRGANLDLYDFLDGQNPILAKHARERLTIYREQQCFALRQERI